MMFDLFSIYYDEVIEQVLAGWERMPNMLALMGVAMSGLQRLYVDYLTFSSRKQFEVSITGQVAYLEVMLNHLFNADKPARSWDPGTLTYPPNTVDGIYIRDYADALPVNYQWEAIEQRSPVYEYETSENHLPPYYMYEQEEYDEQPNFVVMVPIALADLVLDAPFTTRMIAYLERYRMAGAKYIIVNY